MPNQNRNIDSQYENPSQHPYTMSRSARSRPGSARRGSEDVPDSRGLDRTTPRGNPPTTVYSSAPSNAVPVAPSGVSGVDKRAHNLRAQTTTETNRLVDTLKSLERTLGTHIMTLSHILRQPQALERPPRQQQQQQQQQQVSCTTSVTDVESKVDESATLPVVQKKVETSVTVVFLKVGLIEPIHDRFHADVFVQAQWYEPAFNGYLQLNPAEVDWDAIWGPSLHIDNALEDVHTTKWHTITFNDDGIALVHEKQRLEGTFRQYCDIADFPFDTQEVSVVVATSLSDAEISMVVDHKVLPPRVVGQTSGSQQEWKLSKSIVVSRKLSHDPYLENRFSHASLKFSCGISRRSKLYVLEYAFIVCLISAAAFTAFGVDMYKPGPRLMVCILVLLCLVTFQFAVSHVRPSVAYITYLDEYLFAHIVITCLMCIWHAVVPIMPFQPAHAYEFDKYAMASFVVIFLLNELSFLAIALSARRDNTSTIVKKDHSHTGSTLAASVVEHDDRDGRRGVENIVKHENPNQLRQESSVEIEPEESATDSKGSKLPAVSD
ncbi:hypothetical protein LSAT2_023181 [Lamellibrachia satsuma]|nr:hypothetical protein LSAT2_023181 [Lamellibrachia satsuma]